jgi:superfamily II DNA/RNA helicase
VLFDDLTLQSPLGASPCLTCQSQCQAIPAALRGDDVVVAAETGGGKTLAYLLPVLQRLEQHPLPLNRVRLPVALVLTSSADLVRQVAAVLHELQPELAASAVALSSTQQQLGQRRRRATPIVVATPRALMRASSPKDFAFTEIVVVDEADMLLSGGFEKDTKQLLATIRNQPVLRAELNEVDDGSQRSTESEGMEEEEEEDRIRSKDVSECRTQTIFSAISFP